ncbi:MAG: hypothetical protein NY202_04835 [Mollicutes bacterium UO1]
MTKPGRFAGVSPEIKQEIKDLERKHKEDIEELKEIEKLIEDYYHPRGEETREGFTEEGKNVLEAAKDMLRDIKSGKDDGGSSN